MAPTASTPAAAEERHWSLVTVLAPVAVGLAAWGAVLATDAGNPATQWLRAGLVAAWAVAGLVAATRRPHERIGPLVLQATLVGAIASLADAALRAHGHGAHHLSSTALDAAQLVRPLAVALIPVAAMHVLLGLPDGFCKVARSAVVIGYPVGLLIGVGMWTARPELPLWPVALEGVVAAMIGFIGSNHRYRRSAGIERQRMQWFGWAIAVGAEFVVVVLALRLLAGWPPHAGTVLAAATVPVPIALAVGSMQRLIGRIDHMLAHTVSLAGLTGVVVAVYLVIVLGLGRSPTHKERSLLVLSMLAAAVAALLYLPTRERLARFSNRLVYGEREAPDQVLRTFGTRLSRAIPMDELLLQVAESLRKTLALSRAEVWTGSGGQLERSVSVPDDKPAHVSLNGDEETVVARAGVSGPAWLAVWLPQLLAGREDSVVRVAPIVHSGQLLGLIAAVRPANGDP